MNTFHGRWGMFFSFGWAVLHGGLMIRTCQGWGSFTNAFSSNLISKLYLEILPIMKGYTLADKALTNLQNYGSIYS